MPYFGGGASGVPGSYQIENSVWLDGVTDHFSWTPGTGRDSARIWTLSFWVKRTGSLGVDQHIFAAGSGQNARVECFFKSSTDQIQFKTRHDGDAEDWITTRVFRDTNAWYHLVFQFEASNGTATDRLKIYVNGVQETSFSTQNTIPNADHNWLANTEHNIGEVVYTGQTGELHGCIAEFACLDGILEPPTSFGEFNDNGVWVPKNLAGISAWGTKGFWLEFKDADITTNTVDSSGNGNDWTPVSITAAQQVGDTPTHNEIVWNALQNQRDASLMEQGGKNFSHSSGARTLCAVSIKPKTGKYCMAFSHTSTTNQEWQLGLLAQNDKNFNDAIGSNEDVRTDTRILPTTGTVYHVSGSTSSTPSSTSDEIWLAMDYDNDDYWAGIYDDSASSMVWFNATAGTTGNPATGANPCMSSVSATLPDPIFCGCCRNNNNLTILHPDDFQGSVPSGFTYLHSWDDMPTPTVLDGSAGFQALAYTGNGTSPRSVALTGNSAMQTDLVWVKRRSTAQGHHLTDIVRGVGNALAVDVGLVEGFQSDNGYLSDFESDGFECTVGSSDFNAFNINSSLYAAFCWHTQGGAGASNTDGTINTTTTSVSQLYGFSMGTFNGNATSGATVGHGLGAIPQWITVKERTNDSGQWWTYVESEGATKAMVLNTFDIALTSTTYWNDTAPTSTVFSLGNHDDTNGSGDTYVYYAWTEIPGFSKFGEYTGNTNASGPFIWCGFKPAFLMVKNATAGEYEWRMMNIGVNPTNPVNKYLITDTNAGEGTSVSVDFLSNGFRIRVNNNPLNDGSQQFTYMAFAQHPSGGFGVPPLTAH